jgi:propanol-preferring alcohol dehydrogenase
MKVAGLCGSDLHRYRETSEQRAGNNVIQGHEPSGIVEAVGVGVKTVHIGDRVSVYHYRGCGHCKHCLAGNIMWCPDRRGYGWHVHGSCADYLLTDERNCLPLPADLTFADGAFIACTAGTAFSAVRRLQVSGEDTVVIFGLGPVGMTGMLMAKAMGGRVIGVEPTVERQKLAHGFGVDAIIDPSQDDVLSAIRKLTGKEGVDLAFETSGSPAGRQAAADCLRVEGKAVFVGLGNEAPTFDLRPVIVRQLSVLGSYVMPIHMYWDLVDFIVQRQLPLEKLTTHRFPIDEAVEAFQVFDEGKTGKVVLEWA